MPQLYPYRIFISHAWKYDDEYYRLERMLRDAPNFSFSNYSVPRHDPLDTKSIGDKLLDQLRPVQVMIVLAGMYAAHRDWIQYEIEHAVRMMKPIIGVKPWGQERVPEIIQEKASVIHGWNVGPIVDSIRRLA